MFSAVLRNALVAPRPLALRSAIAVRAYSTPSPVTPPPTSNQSTPSPSSASGSSNRPLIDLSGARKRFSPNEDPDAWWKAESAARRFGTPGNQYTGRSLKVVGGFAATYRRLQSILTHTGVSIGCVICLKARFSAVGTALSFSSPQVGACDDCAARERSLLRLSVDLWTNRPRDRAQHIFVQMLHTVQRFKPTASLYTVRSKLTLPGQGRGQASEAPRAAVADQAPPYFGALPPTIPGGGPQEGSACPGAPFTQVRGHRR